MGERAFLQSFEEFEGLHLIKSPLTASVNEASALLNLRFNEGYSLTSRYGFQGIGFEKTGFVSGGTLSYLAPATGATVRTVFGIGPELFYLRDATFTITRTGGSTSWDYDFSPAADGSKYVFTIYQEGETPAAIDVTASTTIYSLIQSIDALTNFSATSTEKFAIVNGNQTTAAGGQSITVDSGHTFVANDNLVFISTNSTLGTHLYGTGVEGISATTVTWESNYNLPATVVDNQVLGVLGSLAAGIKFKVADAANLPTSPDTMTVTFPTWNWGVNGAVVGTRETPPFLSFYRNARTNKEGWAHASSVSANGRAFIGTGVSEQSSPSSSTGYDYLRSEERFPVCFDGSATYRAGLPKAKISSVAESASASTFTAGQKFKYKVVYRHKLRNGDVVLSQPSDEVSFTVANNSKAIDVAVFRPRLAPATLLCTINGTGSYTAIPINALADVGTPFSEVLIQVGGAWYRRKVISVTSTTLTVEKAISVTSGEAIYINSFEGCNNRGGFLASGQAAANTLNFTGLHNFVVGDVLSASYGPSAVSAIDRKITALTSTTVTFDGPPFGTGATAVFASAGMTAILYRTTDGGNLFYKVSEASLIPGLVTATIGATFIDNVTDANLGEQLIESEIGKERDPPPAARIVVPHQGGLVYTGVAGEPNTVAWSAIEEGPEAVPLASNYTDIASNIEGAISGAISDQSDSLMVFKPSATYALSGDLNAGAFVARTLTEGDYGVSSQASLINMGGAIIGVGKLGVKAFNAGGVVREFGDAINPQIVNNADIELSQVVAVNDYANKSVILFFPQRASLGSSLVRDYCYAYNYEKEAWFQRRHSATGVYEPSGGMFMLDDVVCWFSRGGYKGDTNTNGVVLYETNPARYFESSTFLGTFYQARSLYCDFLSILKPSYTTEWIHLDEPSLKKLWLRVKLFRFRQPYEEEDVTNTATYTVRVYKDFFEATPVATYTLNFSSSLIFERVIKLPKLNARAIKVAISTESMTELHTFHLTGWEIAVDVGNYQKVDFLQNSGTPDTEIPDP